MSLTPSTHDERGESYGLGPPRCIQTLEDLLDIDELLKLKQAFEDSKDKMMTEIQFKEILEGQLKMKFNEEDFHILFMKMDEKRNGMVDWDELLSRLLIELQTKDKVVSHKGIRGTALNGSPKFIPSHHRHPISRIRFYPELNQDKSASNVDGKYVTLSKDGTINFWSKEFFLEKSFSVLKGEKIVGRKSVTDFICMPDIMMVAASCNDGSIKFYDTMAYHFVLRVVLTNLREVINCMAYQMSSNPEEFSRILTGDMSGNVLIFSFYKNVAAKEKDGGKTGSRGPFSFRPGEDVKVLFYDGIKKEYYPQLFVKEFLHIHPDGSLVEQISYCGSLKSFISCSTSSVSSLVIQDERASTQVSYRFHITVGVSCFAVYEASYMLATGGVDCAIRLWNAFVPNKTIGVLCGHQAAICALEFLQSALNLLSLSKDKCIKIWDVKGKLCIQTYSPLTSEINKHARLSVYFHHENNKLIIGYTKIVTINYGDKDDEKMSDGTTHAESVTKVLYNPLFKCLVSIGNDSVIMIWDIWTGKCTSLITKAHTQMEHGTTMKVEITAAAFAPVSQQLLVTGARDGSLKVWNFTSGECIRHMSIASNCEVTDVLWLQSRILAIGWNRCVTEFTDLDSGQTNLQRNGLENLDSRWPTLKGCNRKSQNKSDFLGDYKGKCWETRHTEDLVCAAAYPPYMLATASYNGELVLWRIETAQAHRRYHVANPTGRFALDFKKHEQSREDSTSTLSFPSRASVSSLSSASSVSKQRRGIPDKTKRQRTKLKQSLAESNISNVSLIKQMKKLQLSKSLRTNKLLCHSIQQEEEPLAIHSLLFLNSRKFMPNVGNLLVSVEDGNIQVWCHVLQNSNKTENKDEPREKHDNEAALSGQGTGYLGSFSAIHSPGEYIFTMATDEKNEFLFTGDTAGYLKVWLLEDFFSNLHTNSCALYRKCFPFLLKDRFDGEAKKAVQKQLYPVLLSSHRAHLRAITCIEYISEAKIIVSCSSDCSVRLWTLSGCYIGTLGQRHIWPLLEHGKITENIKTRIPPDIARVASFTTMKVLTGGDRETSDDVSETSANEIILRQKDLVAEVNGKQINLEQPLGNHFSLPKRSGKIFLPPKLDHTYGEFVPIYTHIMCPELKDERKPNHLNISCLQNINE